MFQKTQQFSLLCLECGGLQPPAGELACHSVPGFSTGLRWGRGTRTLLLGVSFKT